MTLRPICCWKKRKGSQCLYQEGYDGGAWRCKEGFGCKKRHPGEVEDRRLGLVLDGSRAVFTTFTQLTDGARTTIPQKRWAIGGN